MADVRSLLRQQRAARRIDHPYAAYSDAGKLLCTLCREQIKAETLWESHLQGDAHRQRLQHQHQQLKKAREKEGLDATAAREAPQPQKDGEDEVAQTRRTGQKRKLDADSQDTDMDDRISRKKSRADISIDMPNGHDKDTDSTELADTQPHNRESNRTPPNLARRLSSNTPSQGVELQIPSRPATPAAPNGSSSSSTPGGAAAPLATPSTINLPSRQASSLSSTATLNPQDGQPSSSTAPQVDESEWAAFEADIAADAAPYSEDAVISAPAMTTEQAAAAAAAAANGEGDGDISKRRTKVDMDLEGEREDATRALEDEFEDMQELEARVQKLKERREALRRPSESRHGQEATSASAAIKTVLGGAGKENTGAAVEEVEEEDEDEDDWDAFRFRKG